MELAPGETRELIVLLGLGTPETHGLSTSQEFGTSERCEAELVKLKESWHSLLKSVEVKTPDPELDSMVNVWNAYNSLITYAWSRAASLIYNGERDGLGYRDTVQDFLGVTPLLKEQMQGRLERLLRDFRWDRMDKVFLGRSVTASLDVKNAVAVGGSA